MITNKTKYEKYRPKKFLGQNFLVDENLAKKIVASLDIKENDYVIEIGPGQGVLTKYISEATNNLLAVELDKSIFEKLTKMFNGKIKLLHKDFLKFDFQNDRAVNSGKVKIIGNIPYNITTEILFKLYRNAEQIETAVLMMQKEVAQRLVSKVNTKEYGILAIQTQLSATPKILFNIPPTAFFPKPKVNSSIVKFDFDNLRNDIADRNLLDKLVKESFGQRRKMIKNSLKKFFELQELSFENFNLDFSRRAETFSIDEFVRLANGIREMLDARR